MIRWSVCLSIGLSVCLSLSTGMVFILKKMWDYVGKCFPPRWERVKISKINLTSILFYSKFTAGIIVQCSLRDARGCDLGPYWMWILTALHGLFIWKTILLILFSYPRSIFSFDISPTLIAEILLNTNIPATAIGYFLWPDIITRHLNTRHLITDLLTLLQFITRKFFTWGLITSIWPI